MSIRTKIAILLVGLAVLISGVLGSVGYNALRERLLLDGMNDGLAGVRDEIAYLRLLLHGIREDVVFLADSNGVVGYVSAADEAKEGEKRRIERTFEVLVGAQPRYLRAALVDLSGKETVRVNAGQDAVDVVPRERLQTRGDEPFLAAMASLSKGEVYVSHLRLGREQGAIVVPHQPTIRFASPVFDQGGQRRGGIVVDVDGSRFLSGGAGDDKPILLLDSEGYFLRHRDPALTFGFDLGGASTAERLAPALAGQMRGQTSGTFVSETCIWTAAPCATAFGRLQFDQPADRFWTIVHEQSLAAVLAPLRVQGASFLLAAGVTALFAGFFGYVGARQITRPLDMLARAARRIESGDFEAVVAARGRDELATTARAFNKMAASIKSLIENDQRMLRREREIRTQLEATSAALARSNRDLEQFVYIASHDLKAPLRAIVQLADWLEEDLAPSLQGEVLANLQLLRGRALRLEGLLSGLGEYARASQPGEIPQQVDTGVVVAQAIERLQPPPPVVVEPADDLPVVAAPPGVLDRVFRELIENAIKHRESDACRIRISAEDLGDAYGFQVEDDGPGIPARFHERIFRIFQTLRPRDEVESSGIGLAIVWRLLEVHGGGITVASSPERAGTTFHFTWPKRISLRQVA